MHTHNVISVRDIEHPLSRIIPCGYGQCSKPTMSLRFWHAVWNHYTLPLLKIVPTWKRSAPPSTVSCFLFLHTIRFFFKRRVNGTVWDYLEGVFLYFWMSWAKSFMCFLLNRSLIRHLALGKIANQGIFQNVRDILKCSSHSKSSWGN